MTAFKPRPCGCKVRYQPIGWAGHWRASLVEGSVSRFFFRRKSAQGPQNYSTTETYRARSQILVSSLNLYLEIISANIQCRKHGGTYPWNLLLDNDLEPYSSTSSSV